MYTLGLVDRRLTAWHQRVQLYTLYHILYIRVLHVITLYHRSRRQRLGTMQYNLHSCMSRVVIVSDWRDAWGNWCTAGRSLKGIQIRITQKPTDTEKRIRQTEAHTCNHSDLFDCFLFCRIFVKCPAPYKLKCNKVKWESLWQFVLSTPTRSVNTPPRYLRSCDGTWQRNRIELMPRICVLSVCIIIGTYKHYMRNVDVRPPHNTQQPIKKYMYGTWVLQRFCRWCESAMAINAPLYGL